MRIDRQGFLQKLEAVSPGLATRELIEQSTSFVFTKGKVVTFNDEVACMIDSPLDIEGAVRAKPLLDLLSRLDDDYLVIDQTGGELSVKGVRKKSGFRLESEIRLPIEVIDMPEEWNSLDSEFGDAVKIVAECASKDESEFVFTCVHLCPEYIESTDRHQAIRHYVNVGISSPMLVRSTAIKAVVGFGMERVSEKGAWIHFQNAAGLVMSCRKYVEEYRDLSRFLSTEDTTPMTMPGGLDEILGKAKIFSEDNAANKRVFVDLSQERIVIEGRGVSGWYKEMKTIKYDGNPIKFSVLPDLLASLGEKGNDCRVGTNRMCVDTGKFRFSVCLEEPDDTGVN